MSTNLWQLVAKGIRYPLKLEASKIHHIIRTSVFCTYRVVLCSHCFENFHRKDFSCYHCQPSFHYYPPFFTNFQQVIAMKSSLFLAAPIVVTVLNLGFAIFLNHRHSHAAATTAIPSTNRMQEFRRVRRSGPLFLDE